MRPVNLADPQPWRAMWRVGLPAMLGLSLNAAHQSVDAYFVGRLGAGALAAVSLSLPVAGLAIAVGIGLGVGTATAVARRLGAGDPAAAGRVAGAAFRLATLLGLLVALAFAACHGPIARALAAGDTTLAAQARPYLALLGLVAGMGMVQVLCDFTAIGEGNTRFSLATLALCFGLNMALDPLLIFGLGLGVAGAAWATVIAQAVTLALWLWYFRRGPGRVRPVRAPLRLLGPVLRIGLPETAAALTTTLGFVAVYRLAAEAGGAAAVAGLGIALRLLVLATLPVEGFCLGVQAMIAHAAGAGDPRRVAAVVQRLAALACGAAGLAGLAALLLAGPLAGLFTADPAVAARAQAALLPLAIACPAIALRVVAQVTLQATERAGLAALLGLAPMGWLLWPLLVVLLPRMGEAALASAIGAAALLAGLGGATVIARTLLLPLRRAGHPA